MEEENRKGPGVFYAVVGVATLVVAIIGATFAYFSASTGEQGAGVITDETMNLNNASLSLTVDRVVFNDATVVDKHLVPAYFGKTGDPGTLNVAAPGNLTYTQLSSMLTNNCEQGNYTGCHVYRITASSTETLPLANIKLDLSVGNLTGAANVVDKTQWGYVVFQATETMDGTETTETDSFSTISSSSIVGSPAAIGNGVTDLDIHNAGLTAGTPVTYYLLVYVNDTDVSQNAVNEGTGTNDYVVGTYSGDVELSAMGGVVRATFTS